MRRQSPWNSHGPVLVPVLVLLSSALALVASGCRNEIVDVQQGELVVQWTDSTGAQVLNREASFEFGAVFSGRTEVRTLVVKNLGKGALTLSELKAVDGDAVSIAAQPSADAVFGVAFAPGGSVGPGEVREIPLVFQPPQSAELSVDYTATLSLHVENAPAEVSTAQITLHGRGLNGQCELPETIDFGTVAVDQVEERTLEIKNPTELPALGYVSPPEGNDGPAFTFANGSPSGDVDLGPGENATITLHFQPTESRAYLAHLRARASADCPEKNIRLVGNSVDQVLTWKPALLDFGPVPVTLTGTKTLTFTNLGNHDVQVSEIASNSPTEFEPAQNGLTVPAGGTQDLEVTYHSTVLGSRVGKLTFKTSLATQPMGTVGLSAFGGGPDIDVKPSETLNFGKVAFFQTPGGTLSQIRRVAVMNVGSKQSVNDTGGNLHLGQSQQDGSRGEPYAVITPENADTSASEFTVSIAQASNYDPAIGLAPQAGKNLAQLEIKLTPSSATKKQAKLTIYSDDLDEPEVTLEVVADVVVLPPCHYQVSPTTIDFGVVAPSDYKDLGFTITNLGVLPGDTCLISDVSMQPGSDPAFSLSTSNLGEHELEPGESMDVTVRAWPQSLPSGGINTITGDVGFYVSSDVNPTASVSVKATVASSCVVVAPDEADFGTVEVGCHSATRTFSIYNSCSGTVTLNSIGIIAGAGQAAGGTNCPGTSPCPEFFLTQTPAIPSGGLSITSGGAPVTFQARYAPIDFGSDPGVIGVTVTENNQTMLHTVTLAGKGDSQGLQTDVFVQDSTPSADILLTIDGSCSMSTKQALLASNMDSFFTQANQDGVDYRIAVIKGQGSGSNTSVGEFLSGTGHPDRILTPKTTDVKNQFKLKVAVGANGADEQCFDPSLKALSAPLSTTTNANFLRPNASLAIVCITDDSDYSPNTVTYYYAALQNIKGANHKSLFSINAIAAFQNICTGSLQEDGRYADMVQLSGGVKAEICDPNWAATLESIGQVAFGARGTYYLTSTPDLAQGPIQCTIDGVPRSATLPSGQTVWTWDSVTNSVTFDPLWRPEAGSTIEFQYFVSCL